MDPRDDGAAAAGPAADEIARDFLGRRLIMAVRAGDAGWVQALLEQGADPTYVDGAETDRDMRGETPLHVAAVAGGPENVEIARLLIQQIMTNAGSAPEAQQAAVNTALDRPMSGGISPRFLAGVDGPRGQGEMQELFARYYGRGIVESPPSSVMLGAQASPDRPRVPQVLVRSAAAASQLPSSPYDAAKHGVPSISPQKARPKSPSPSPSPSISSDSESSLDDLASSPSPASSPARVPEMESPSPSPARPWVERSRSPAPGGSRGQDGDGEREYRGGYSDGAGPAI